MIMTNLLFVFTLAVLSAVLFNWGFRVLPGERWQILASVPVSKDESESWRGANLTYYGLLIANAYTAAAILGFVLLGAIGTPLHWTLAVVISLTLLCVPVSRIAARLVEKKSSTLTVGGASFVGIIAVPWLVWLLNETLGRVLHYRVPLICALAALSIAYALGEGLGRLACISFGCCYGKPLSETHPLLRRVLNEHSFIFRGKTKKIAYAGHMDGVKVVPIQAITAILYVGAGLLCSALFLESYYTAAYLVSLVVTQGWRAFSEIFRADYRGGGKLSAYQWMSIAAVIYALAVSLVLAGIPVAVAQPNILGGLRSVWRPAMVLFLQALWLAVFFYAGRSMVTGSTLSFHVLRDRI
jgi:hypothetical protein